MSKIQVSEDIIIDASLDHTKNIVADFHHWNAWSPWLITDPKAEIAIQKDGKFYQWHGKRVGMGRMRITAETDNQIDYDLTFLKPWKSQAKVQFLLREEGHKTHLTWTMNSSLPFFLFWMRRRTEAFIAMDYQRGLTMLKEYAESGVVNSKLEFLAPHKYEGCVYLGIKTVSSFNSVDADMKKDFTELRQWLSENKIPINGIPFSIYHNFNAVKDSISHTAAIPLVEIPSNYPNHWKIGKLPKMTLKTVRHTGPYKHVGNAWSAAMMMIRNKEFKVNQKIKPMEFYRNDPSETPAEQLISDVSFAVKT